MKISFMKSCMFLLLLFSAHCYAQKPSTIGGKETNKKTAVTDSATYTFLFPVIKMMQVAEDPKKGTAFIMTDLKETNAEGQAVYAAPYTINNFKSILVKKETDRIKQTTTWEWTGTFFEAPKGSIEQGTRAERRADSLLKLLQYKRGNSPNTISYVGSYFYDFTNPAAAGVRLIFTKGLHNSEQEAYDSLIKLYKPLLFAPAFSSGAAQQLGYALQLEGFDKNKINACFKDLLNEVANKNAAAAYQLLLGVPGFVDFKALKEQLRADKRNEITAMAKKQVDEFYEKERRKINGDPVVAQEKKLQNEKSLNGCTSINANQQNKYQLGITMISTQNGTPFIVRLTSIDCATKTVTITKPGKRTAHDFVLHLPFDVYERYEIHAKQFHRCNNCGGEGGERVTEGSTTTKELPFGYFSGVRTTSTRTTTKTYWEECYKCSGTGWTLD